MLGETFTDKKCRWTETESLEEQTSGPGDQPKLDFAGWRVLYDT